MNVEFFNICHENKTFKTVYMANFHNQLALVA